MKSNHPITLSETQTLAMAIDGTSLARLGDGELRLARGGQSASQKLNPSLAKELRDILDGKGKALPCIPNLQSPTPEMWFWRKYLAEKWTSLYSSKVKYGSTWITRPDCAPWIDTPEYWRECRKLWQSRDILLVVGDSKSLTEKMIVNEAKSCAVITAKRRDAYDDIDEIEEQIGFFSGSVLLCLGATATALAARLANKDLHAVDCGHLGMFIRRRTNQLGIDDVASDEYRATLRRQRELKPGWGGSGHHHAPLVISYAHQIAAQTILDYGCGTGSLKKAINYAASDQLIVDEYDPGVIGKDVMPEAADLVVATDVLEHIEEDRLKNVLHHIKSLRIKGCFFIIAKKPAKDSFEDGRNVHLIVRDTPWWLDRLEKAGFKITRYEERKGLYVWTL